MSWLTKYLARRQTSAPKVITPKVRFRPSLLDLEDRTVPTVIVNPVFGAEPFLSDRQREMSNTNVALIFWGDFWNGTNSAQSVAIQQAAQKVLDSGYLGLLTQYRSDEHANLGMTWLNQHVQSVWGTVTVPTGHFSAYGIYGVVNTALYNTFGVYGGPSNTIYAVVTPPGVADDTPTDAGFNSDSTMWIGVNVRSQANSVSIPAMQDSFSWTFGHEVAETMSDPSPLFGAIHNGVNFAPGNLFLDDLGHQIGDNEGNSYATASRTAHWSSHSGRPWIKSGQSRIPTDNT